MSNPTASNPTASNQPLPPIDPQIGLMVSAAEHLIPLFECPAIDRPLARRMAASALYAYNPETHADFVSAARIIAFSMAALALLGKTASPNMTMPEQMRAFGRANALNRSADQSERTMMQRRRYDKANPQAEQPARESEPPDTQLDDADVQASIASVMQEYLAARQPSATETTAPKPTPKPTPEPATAKPQPQPEPTTPPSAIRTSVPMSQAAQPATTLKEALLRQSAMQRVGGQSGAQHPR